MDEDDTHPLLAGPPRTSKNLQAIKSHIRDSDWVLEEAQEITNNEHKQTQEEHRLRRIYSILGGFNLINTILGSGLLALPYAISRAGITLGFLIMIALAIVADYTIWLLIRICRKSGISYYEDLGDRAYGTTGRILTIFCIVIQNVATILTYLKITSRLLNILFVTIGADDSSLWIDSRVLMSLIGILIVFPFSSVTKIRYLGYSSGFSVLLMTFFIIAIIVKFRELGNSCRGNGCDLHWIKVSEDFPLVLPLISFSFVPHQVLLSIFSELDTHGKQELPKVSHLSISFSLIVYIIFALFGYANFRKDVEGNIIENYLKTSQKSALTQSISLFFLSALILTIPLLIFSCRNALLLIIRPKVPQQTLFSDEEEKTELKSWLFWIGYEAFTLLIIIILILMAMFIPNLDYTFGFAGATSSVMLVFILPALFYLKIEWEVGSKKEKHKILCFFLLFFGTCMMIVSFVSEIIGIINGKAPFYSVT